jgi:ferredoxin-NADP reductase
MKYEPHHECTWHISAIRDEAPHVKTLVLETAGERPRFIAGQYLTVRIPGFEPSEGKSYSISSIPTEKHITLTIREMGAFSKKLLAHRVGDILTTSLPYGFFYPEDDEKRTLVFVVGGIGITPCISIIESKLTSGSTFPITLFYSNRAPDDIVFKERIETLVRTYPHFSVHHFITRAPETDATYTYRHMNADDIHKTLKDVQETDFFICGSIGFTKDLWKSLKESNIPPSYLYTEGFF